MKKDKMQKFEESEGESKAEHKMEGKSGEMQEMPEMKDYEVECAANDLLRAEEVKANKDLHKKALAHLGKKKAAIESIEDLKAAKDEAFKPKY